MTTDPKEFGDFIASEIKNGPPWWTLPIYGRNDTIG